MEHQRFDELARSFARKTPRRSILGGAAAALAAAFGLRQASPSSAKTRAQNGTPCSSPRDCASGLCVDGYCCDAPCMETCAACNVAGAEGTCVAVTGAPVNGRGPCPGDGGACSGICDGVTTSHCAGFPAAETACGPTTCVNGWQVSQVCSGTGACIQSNTSCGAYACDPSGSHCLDACAGDGDCLGEAHCAGGICQGDLPLGSACGRADQCQGGHCVDGVCCNTACDGICEICGADGFCGEEADNAPCADGVCCQGACISLGSEANCLACGDVCVNGETCCDEGCVVLGDEANCLACGDVCVNGEVCCDDGCTRLGTTADCLACGDICTEQDDCNRPYCTPQGCGTTPANYLRPCNDGADGFCQIDGTCRHGECPDPAPAPSMYPTCGEGGNSCWCNENIDGTTSCNFAFGCMACDSNEICESTYGTGWKCVVSASSCEHGTGCAQPCIFPGFAARSANRSPVQPTIGE